MEINMNSYSQVLVILFLLSCSLAFEEKIKTTKDARDNMLNILLQHNFRLLYQITPETSIVEYRGSITESDVHLLVSELQKRHTDWILSIEKVIVYEDVLKPEQVIQRSDFHADKIVEPERFYGMGVPQAWELGYTGKGIVIAVTDVGMHTNLLDLTNQIDEDMCYNYINDNRNITPEFFHNHQAESDKYTTRWAYIWTDFTNNCIQNDVFIKHGDQCASLIASEYGNGLCSSGIAFNATRVGLKIFEVTFNGRLFDIEHKYWTRSDIISRAFANNSGIDIYSNAWAPEHPFTPLDLPTKEAIRYGGEEGRMGLGTIYVVPAGPVGNELANNIYTIAVNGIGVNGSIHNDSKLCASVITSGLADGSNISARYMLTTTRNNNCVTSFKGVSPATAQIAAIIGLALEANPNLTLRDIQHLLIQSSEYVGKVEKRNLIKNGAGRLFHKVLGYGLLNATKLVVLAETRQQIPALLKQQIRKGNGEFRSADSSSLEVNFCHSCIIADDELCLSVVEHVTLNIKFRTSVSELQLVLVSPSGTESVLLDFDNVLEKEIHTIELLSVHFWDELSLGNWRLKVTVGTGISDAIDIYDASLTMYGTSTTLESTKRIQCPIYKINEVVKHKHIHAQKIKYMYKILSYIGNAVVAIFLLAILAYKLNLDNLLKKLYLNCFSIPQNEAFDIRPQGFNNVPTNISDRTSDV